METAPTAPGSSGNHYGYFYVTNYPSGSNCPAFGSSALQDSGVNIRIYQSDSDDLEDIFLGLDIAVDGGDGRNCGRIRKGGVSESIYYLIGRDQFDFSFDPQP